MVQTVTHTVMLNNLTEGVLACDVLIKHMIAVYSSAVSGLVCVHAWHHLSLFA